MLPAMAKNIEHNFEIPPLMLAIESHISKEFPNDYAPLIRVGTIRQADGVDRNLYLWVYELIDGLRGDLLFIIDRQGGIQNRMGTFDHTLFEMLKDKGFKIRKQRNSFKATIEQKSTRSVNE